MLALVLILGVAAAAPAASPVDEFSADFEEFWELVDRNYAYFDDNATDWKRVRERFAPLAADAESRVEFIGVLERALSQLQDHHAHLGTNTPDSPPMIPSQTDLWGVWRNGSAVLDAVRPRSPAERSGLRAGMEVVGVDGKAIAGVVGSDQEATDFALRVALAGRRGKPRLITCRDENGVDRDFELKAFIGNWESPAGTLTASRLDGDVGLIRLNDSLGDTRLIERFDQALVELRDTRGLILDLRDTASGGNTTVARGLMGRLIATEGPYQKHERPSEKLATGIERSWLELVSPRGPFTYTAPVVVIVDRWTGSMGEGLAIGLDGLGRADVVGTRMAGLLGAIESFELGETGIPVRFATERLRHVNGTPREAFVPPVLVQLATATGSDPILEAALAVLGKGGRSNSLGELTQR